MKKLILATALIVSLTGNVLAAETPDAIVTQSINGTRQHIRTYTTPPDVDPSTLIEAPFKLGNYLYTYASTAKEENHFLDEKPFTDTVTVYTDSDALPDVLNALPPALEHDNGQYRGSLHLDHKSIHTEATGYTTQIRTYSETVTLPSLPSNDMSLIPATTVRDGITLVLDEVNWQVQTTSLLDDALIPTAYTATATYSAEVPYTVATGYITTAEYTGTIISSGVESVTYTITYLGSKIDADDTDDTPRTTTPIERPLLILSIGIGLITITLLVVTLIRYRRKSSVLNSYLNVADHSDFETEDQE